MYGIYITTDITDLIKLHPSVKETAKIRGRRRENRIAAGQIRSNLKLFGRLKLFWLAIFGCY